MLKVYLRKVPTLAVIGVTGLVAWPIFFDENDSGPSKASAGDRVASKPPASAGEASMRNPFLVESPRGSTPTVAVASASASAAKPAGPHAAAGPASKAEARKADLPAMPSEEDRVLAGMRLIGTFIDGRENIAVINNKVYARGDQLRGADGSLLPYVVAEVRADRALVRRGRRDFEIAFSDVPRMAAPAPNPPAPMEQSPAGPKPEPTTGAVASARAKGPAPKGQGPSGGPGRPEGDDPPVALRAREPAGRRLVDRRRFELGRGGRRGQPEDDLGGAGRPDGQVRQHRPGQRRLDPLDPRRRFDAMSATLTMSESDSLAVSTLIRRGIIEGATVEEARKVVAKTNSSHERALVRAGVVEDRAISEAYAEEFLLTRLDPAEETTPVDLDLVELIPEKLCYDRLIVPLAVRDDTVDVAVRLARGDVRSLDEIQHLTGLRVRLLLAPLQRRRGFKLHALFKAGRAEEIGGKASEFADVQIDEVEEEEDPDDGILLARRPAPPGGQRQDRPDGQPDPRAGPEHRRQRHPPRAVRGLVQVPAPGRRRAPRAPLAVEDGLHHDRLAVQDPGPDGHRREAHPPGRRHRPEDQGQARSTSA